MKLVTIKLFIYIFLKSLGNDISNCDALYNRSRLNKEMGNTQKSKEDLKEL
jgi:hypothetical protein